MPAPNVEKIVSFSILSAAALVTLMVILKADVVSSAGNQTGEDLRGYPLNFFGGYLAIFAAFWLYALPEYMATSNGITARGTPIGSLAYAIGCYLLCILMLYANRLSIWRRKHRYHVNQAVA